MRSLLLKLSLWLLFSLCQSRGIRTPQQIQINQQREVILNLFEDDIDQDGRLYEAKNFKFHVDFKIPERDLLIFIQGLQDKIHSPSLYYSITDEYPSKDSPNSYFCGHMGYDICSVTSQLILAQSPIYIGVHCHHSCKFNLKVFYSETIFIQSTQYFYLQLNEQSGFEAQEIKIQLEDPFSNCTNFLIHIDQIAQNNISETFNVYLNKGNKVPTNTLFDEEGKEIWFFGKGFLINNNSKTVPFQRGSNYTLLILAPAGSSFVIQTEIYGDIRKTYFNYHRFDMVKMGEIQKFELNLQGDQLQTHKDQISIYLEPFLGNPNMYINFDQIPDELSLFQWNSEEKVGSEHILITQNDLNFYKGDKKQLYIVIHGISTASFRLEVQKQNNGKNLLFENCVESGWARQNDIIVYQLFTYQMTQTNITISSVALSGKVNLFVQICSSDMINNCTFDRKSLESITNYQKILIGKSNGPYNNIKFEYDPESCYENVKIHNNKIGCFFLIIIENASNDYSNPSHYQLSVSHDHSHIILKENQIYQNELKMGQFQYFKLTIPEEVQEIYKLTISITSITGEIDVFVSRTNQFPNEINNEFRGNLHQNLFQFDELSEVQEQKSLSGNYYFQIYGLSTSIFEIHFNIFRRKNYNDEKNQLFKEEYKHIYQGSAERGYLEYKKYSPTYYFQAQKGNLKNVRVTITYQAIKQDTQQIFYLEYLWPLYAIFDREKKDQTIINLKVEDEIFTNDLISFELNLSQTQNNRFFITLQHSMISFEDYQIKYFLSVNREGTSSTIHQGFAYMVKLFQNESKDFSLYVPENDYQLYFEIFYCDLVTQENMEADQIVNENNDDSNIDSVYLIKKDQIKQSQFFRIITWSILKKGYFSLKMKQKKESIQKQSSYKFIPHLIKSGQESPQKIFFVQGNIRHQLIMVSNKNLRHQIIVPQLKSKFEKKDFWFQMILITYNLRISNLNQKQQNLYHSCGYSTDSNELFTKANLLLREYTTTKKTIGEADKNYKNEIKFEIEENFMDYEGNIHISLMAMITVDVGSKFQILQNFYFPYESLQIQKNQQFDNYQLFSILIWNIILIIFGCLSIVISVILIKKCVDKHKPQIEVNVLHEEIELQTEQIQNQQAQKFEI